MPEQHADFVETVSALLQASNSRVKGAVVVKVQSFSRTACTAVVEPQVRRGAETEAPITDVPVLFPGARWDVQAGEYGVLLTAGLNWRRWWRTGQVSPVEDGAQHDNATGVLLLGLHPQSAAPSIPSSSTVLEKPTVGGTVRLGDAAATKAVVHEDLLSGLANLLGVLDTWGASVGTATGVAWGPVQLVLQAVVNSITLGVFQSPSVKVED